ATTEDVNAMKTRWEAEGLIPREEMQTTCCYALQDKAWVNDPDGNEWEVFVVLGNTEPETSSCACGSKVAEAAISSSVCCTDTQKASTIGATNQPCC
ncbi:MAG TPA: hypothetical protein VHL50_00470, partial [Pyrinomonadaceae bacterium]|nr:hypothetical protein [Pyrinomonadaceae bacterium]